MKTRKVIAIIGCCIIGLIIVGSAYFTLDTHIAIKNTIEKAQKSHQYKDDNVKSLIEYVNTESHSLTERNMAVWVLGRMRAKEALQKLESLYTGEKCNHRTTICQYELVKALKRCDTKLEIHSKEYYVND
jgi:hypothetical protein